MGGICPPPDGVIIRPPPPPVRVLRRLSQGLRAGLFRSERPIFRSERTLSKTKRTLSRPKRQRSLGLRVSSQTQRGPYV